MKKGIAGKLKILLSFLLAAGACFAFSACDIDEILSDLDFSMFFTKTDPDDETNGNETDTPGEDGDEEPVEETWDELTSTEGLIFELNEDGESYTLVGVEDFTLSEIVIAGTHEELPVTAIGETAFTGCELLQVLTIDGGITSFNVDSLSDCPLLEKICYNRNATSWAQIQFNATPFSSAGELCIYNSETDTYERAESVVIRAENISDYAFASCGSLESVTIKNAETVGRYAFFNCPSLTTVTVKSARSVGWGAFASCYSLSSVELEEVSEIGAYAFYYCTELGEIALGSALEKINANAFAGCESLALVTLPASVTFLGYNAFWSCTASIVWEEEATISAIGENAFCGYLGTSITLPDSVTIIGSGAFQNCSNLTTLMMGSKVALIGNNAFEGCELLSLVLYGGGEEDWQSILFTGELSDPSCYGAAVYYYSEENPYPEEEEGDEEDNSETEDENENNAVYWHYVDDVITVWAKEAE